MRIIAALFCALLLSLAFTGCETEEELAPGTPAWEDTPSTPSLVEKA